MNKLLLASLLLCLSLGGIASEVISTTENDSLKAIDLVVGITSTYSKSSELEAKIVELLAGDGMNATRMVLVLSNGDLEVGSKIFELGLMISSVRRVSFYDVDRIIINYTQDDFDENDRIIQVNRSIKLKVIRDEKGNLTDKIERLN
jgi:hypothetical protein